MVLLTASTAWFSLSWYLKNTIEVPKAGGSYTEALVDTPHFLNPLLTTNDADRDLSSLIFSGLVQYDAQGNLVPDLAENFEQSPNGKTYTFKLKPNILWHDGQTLTAKDVLFTINAVQNPDYKSPLRANWQGVKVRTEGSDKIIIELKTPYMAFRPNLTLGILPSHIWQAVLPQNFPLADFNQKPIGSGPYKFARLTKDRFGKISLIELQANPNYFSSVPYLQKIIFKSYNNETEAIAAFNRKEVDGLGSLNHQTKNQLRGTASTKIYSIIIPRIYAVFFNTDDEILKSYRVRLALNYGLDKNELSRQIVGPDGTKIKGPIPPSLIDDEELASYHFNVQKAERLLDDDLWTKKETSITRSKKLNKKDKDETALKITLVTVNTLQLIETASLIKNYWQSLGVNVELNILAIEELQQSFLRPRKYQAILIGEIMGLDPDPLAFWHSKETKDPGLNLSLYRNKKVDQILEKARQINDPDVRMEEYLKFEKQILADVPAVFLYSPNYLYALPENLKGVNQEVIAIPSNRLNSISQWYLATKRVWKK